MAFGLQQTALLVQAFRLEPMPWSGQEAASFPRCQSSRFVGGLPAVLDTPENFEMVKDEAASHRDISASRVKTPRRLPSGVARDARRDSVVPKKDPIAQKLLLKR